MKKPCVVWHCKGRYSRSHQFLLEDLAVNNKHYGNDPGSKTTGYFPFPLLKILAYISE